MYLFKTTGFSAPEIATIANNFASYYQLINKNFFCIRHLRKDFGETKEQIFVWNPLLTENWCTDFIVWNKFFPALQASETLYQSDKDIFQSIIHLGKLIF